MASVDDSFQQVVEKFKKRLTRDEQNEFKFTSLRDVLASVELIQVEQGQRNSMMNLTRIKRFLEAMRQYGTIVEVFLNASSLLCFIWGPMKFCLMVSKSSIISQVILSMISLDCEFLGRLFRYDT